MSYRSKPSDPATSTSHGLNVVTAGSEPQLSPLEPDLTAWKQWLGAQGEPGFRATQIRHWLYHRRADSWQQMTDLPQQLRQQLADRVALWQSEVVAHHQADDGTEKLVLQFRDGSQIECVLLRDGLRRSVCLSSQVGCAMACTFCASGLDGVRRNLTSAEILEQLLRLQQLLPADERLSHIVMMGMGEPLANLEAVLPALDLASSAQGLGISARRITISTVGLPRAIDRLIQRKSRFQLAVSLHAPSDELRNRIVPTNRATGLVDILDAADRYFATSGRRLTFEYVLLGGVNDQPHQARQLGALLGKRIALLNLIPYNYVAGLDYQTPSPAAVREFSEILTRMGVTVQVRQRKGDAISAACGQLRRTLQP